jgi:hypothetical protein
LEHLVNVPIELFQVAFVAAVFVPFIALVRLLAGRDDLGFADLVRFDASLPWPKGVQEEEPQPWKFGPAAS